MVRIALIWPEAAGDFPKLVVDDDVQIYSIEPFSEMDRIYLMGPNVVRVSEKSFDAIIDGEITSYDVLPRELVEKDAKNAPSVFDRPKSRRSKR